MMVCLFSYGSSLVIRSVDFLFLRSFMNAMDGCRDRLQTVSAEAQKMCSLLHS